MNVSTQQAGNVTIVAVAGSIDGFSADELLRDFESRILAGARQIVLDLKSVEFISSAGLRTILLAQKQARQNDGDLRLAGSSSRILKTLKLSGYTSIFKLFDTAEEAAASFAVQE